MRRPRWARAVGAVLVVGSVLLLAAAAAAGLGHLEPATAVVSCAEGLTATPIDAIEAGVSPCEEVI